MPDTTSEAPRPDDAGARTWRAVLRGRPLVYAALALAITSPAPADEPAAPSSGDRPSAAPAPGEPLETLRWLDVARRAIDRNDPSARRGYLVLAGLAGAQLAAAERAMTLPGASRATVRGAVAGASVRALGAAFRADVALFQRELAAEREALGPTQREAFVVGQAVARALGARASALDTADARGAAATDVLPAARWSLVMAEEILGSAVGELDASRALAAAASAALAGVTAREAAMPRLALR